MRLLWFRFRDASRRNWKAFIVDKVQRIRGDEDDGETGVPLVGITHFDRREIEVSVNQPPNEFYLTAVHELMHACGGTKTVSLAERAGEECFIQRAERSMLAVWKQFGATFPELPKGVTLAVKKRGAR